MAAVKLSRTAEKKNATMDRIHNNFTRLVVIILSVIILNYNVRYFLELCIKSVLESVSTIDAEVIVVDNNSSDDSCLMLEEVFRGQIRVIENKENLGFSRAYNKAVESCLGNYICILNPDTVVAEDTFVKSIDLFESKKVLNANLHIPKNKRFSD